MPRNVEVKARIESVNALKPAAARIADDGPVEIAQDDTFFQCRSGRLKLRTFSSDAGELIEKNGARLRIDLLPGATASAVVRQGYRSGCRFQNSLFATAAYWPRNISSGLIMRGRSSARVRTNDRLHRLAIAYQTVRQWIIADDASPLGYDLAIGRQLVAFAKFFRKLRLGGLEAGEQRVASGCGGKDCYGCALRRSRGPFDRSEVGVLNFDSGGCR